MATIDVRVKCHFAFDVDTVSLPNTQTSNSAPRLMAVSSEGGDSKSDRSRNGWAVFGILGGLFGFSFLVGFGLFVHFP